MKAITIWQPWASLIALGAKQIYVKKFETRSWATNYRGSIAIHAAAKNPETIFIEPNTMLEMQKVLNINSFEELPLGKIIAIADLVDCHKIINVCDKVKGRAEYLVTIEQEGYLHNLWIKKEELLFGDWTPGRCAWELANVQMLPQPIPAKGKQRLWEWEKSSII